MQSLPGITICEQQLVLPVSNSDFLFLLRALTESAEVEQRAQWLRLLLQSPTMLIWSFDRSREARDISSLVDGLVSGAIVDAESLPPASSATTFTIDPDWSSHLGEYLHKLREMVAAPVPRTPHTVGTAVRFGSSISRVGAAARHGLASSREADAPENAALLKYLERIVQPFWTISGRDSRGWIDELFAAFHFRIGTQDQSTDGGTFSSDDVETSIESWDPSGQYNLDNVLSVVVERLSAAKRIAADFETEKLASLKQLAYGASHEINNPLANIATRAQLLLSSEKDDTRRKHLATIFQQAMRAHEMISDMMLFAHPPVPVLQSVDLIELIRKACREFGPLVEQTGWTIGCSSDAEEIKIKADPSQIISLLQAIVQNSLESRSSGQVSITCLDPCGSKCALEIRDNGPGVSAQAMRHMFDPFYSGREAGRGLGFGLSKAWTIARLHGGDIRVKSTGPEGTTIVVELPIGN